MATDLPASPSDQPAETSSSEDDREATSAAQSHLSETIHMEQWLRLLIVLATLLLLFLVVAVAVRLLAAIGHTLLIFSLGGLLAYALDPLVERVRGSADANGGRRSRVRSALLVFLAIFGCIALAGALLTAPAVRQVTALVHEHAVYEAQAHERLAAADDWLAGRNINLNLSGYLQNPPANVRTWGETVAENALRALEHLSKDIVEGLIVLLIALYFLIYSEEMRAGVNRALPDRLLPYLHYWQDDVNHILGGFVRGQLLLALAVGAMATMICFALGLKLWLLIGLFVVVAALVPVVGPFIGAIPAVVAALVSPNAHFHPALRVALLLAGFGIINEIGSKILYPRLVGAALGLHEVLVLFILFAGFEVGGLTGVLFAAPLTALALVTLTHLYRLWQGLPPVSVAQAARQGALRAKARGTP